MNKENQTIEIEGLLLKKDFQTNYGFLKNAKKLTSMWVEFLHKKPKVIFDLGANAGLYSLFFSKACPKSKIYSFEPIKDNFDLLSRNVHLNKKKDTIFPNNFGIWRESKSMNMGLPLENFTRRNEFYPGENVNTGLYSIHHIENKDYVHTCDFKHIDDAIKVVGAYPEFLKLDIEGAERDVLKSAIESKDALKNTFGIVVEINKEYNNVEEIDEILAPVGFEIAPGQRRSGKSFDIVWKRTL